MCLTAPFWPCAVPLHGVEMGERAVKYDVIIPHYNDVIRLERCLTALSAQAGTDVSILVADNNSTFDLEPIKAQFPNIRFVIQTEKGAGPARNLGMSVTDAPWVFFIDADCVPADDWIAVGKRIAKEGHIIGGPVEVFHETPPPQSGAEAFEAVFAFKMQAYLERDAFLGAGNLILPRAVFDQVGGFRAAVAEDKDWSQRAARAGFTLSFDTGFVASHPSRQDWKALRHKWRRLMAEGFLLQEQGLMSRIKWVGRGLVMPLSILPHTPRIFAKKGLTLQEKLRAFGTLVRLRFCRMGWMVWQAATGKA
jgi:glycosyltransferase involved in cell wall biosynthesis